MFVCSCLQPDNDRVERKLGFRGMYGKGFGKVNGSLRPAYFYEKYWTQ